MGLKAPRCACSPSLAAILYWVHFAKHHVFGCVMCSHCHGQLFAWVDVMGMGAVTTSYPTTSSFHDPINNCTGWRQALTSAAQPGAEGTTAQAHRGMVNNTGWHQGPRIIWHHPRSNHKPCMMSHSPLPQMSQACHALLFSPKGCHHPTTPLCCQYCH